MKKITIILLALSASTAFADNVTPLTDEQRKQVYQEGVKFALQMQKDIPNTQGYKEGEAFAKELCKQYGQQACQELVKAQK